MAEWATKDDVKERLADKAARGYTDPDIQAKLIRSQDDVRAKLQVLVSDATMNAWTITTVPKIVRSMVADLATAKMFAEVWGESYTDVTSNAASWKKLFDERINDLHNGRLVIVDTAGDNVDHDVDVIESNKTGSTANISMRSLDDSDYGDGTLDDF